MQIEVYPKNGFKRNPIVSQATPLTSFIIDAELNIQRGPTAPVPGTQPKTKKLSTETRKNIKYR